LFFLVVGLEIKRELLMGELNSVRKASLPLLAAVGGMLVPAGLYLAVASRQSTAGWGVPMATDIAFALGVARLLGNRVPTTLLVFLTAFAIADDLGAILVIALFYGHSVNGVALAVAVGLFGVLIGMNRLGVSRRSLYLLVGLPLWVAVLKSGLHATIAGVLVGLCVPARVKGMTAESALHQANSLLDEDADPSTDAREAKLDALEAHVESAQSPLTKLEHALHPYVAYAILPLFAFANAGIDLREMSLGNVWEPVTLGVVLGLVLGKPLGILLFSGLAVRAGWAELPAGVSWRMMAGASVLGGIGFTMSLFVASLAFEGEPAIHLSAKLGILLASAVAAAAGLAILRSGTERAV